VSYNDSAVVNQLQTTVAGIISYNDSTIVNNLQSIVAGIISYNDSAVVNTLQSDVAALQAAGYITDGNTGWDNSYGFFNNIANFTGTLTDTKYCTYNSGTGKIVCNSEGGLANLTGLFDDIANFTGTLTPNKYCTYDSDGYINCTSDGGLTTMDNVWAESGNNIYNNNTGKVGIGTDIPSSRLTVKGNSTVDALNVSINTNEMIHVKSNGDVYIG
jgi:hypothetical protein